MKKINADTANITDGSGNYASVVNQSGLFAGDGGFNVKATNNTDLKGAVISSRIKGDRLLLCLFPIF